MKCRPVVVSATRWPLPLRFSIAPSFPIAATFALAAAIAGTALLALPVAAQDGNSAERSAAPRDQTYSTLRPYIAPGEREPQAPSRVARVLEAQGEVRLWDADTRDWDSAERNRVLASGDRLSTGRNARAELRIGSTEIRIGERSEFEVLRLDDDRMQLLLHSGQMAVRVRQRDIVKEVELLTAEARLRPERIGHYRLDREDNTTYASTWRGSLRIVGDNTGFNIGSGQRVEIWQSGGTRYNAVAPVTDAFSDWVARDEQADAARSASSENQRYVSPEMTGVEDLDRYGRWDRHPDYGPVWYPTVVASGWAPFRQGRWVWRVRWGWTWVDSAPWGFAPFHYGRWVWWGGRWAWAPGELVARPVYAPALVAWVGGPVGHGGSGVSFSISIGGALTPAVGWAPLAPWEVYTPAFPCPPTYVTVVNRPHVPPPNRVQPVRTGPIMYSNQGVAGAVTVVPRNALSQGQPVAAVAVSNSDVQVQRAIAAERFSSGAAPQRLTVTPQATIAAPTGTSTVAVQPVPGGAVALPRPAPGAAVPLPSPAAVAPVGAAPGTAAPIQGRAQWLEREKQLQDQRANQARDPQMNEIREAQRIERQAAVERSAQEAARNMPPGTTGVPVQRAPAAVEVPAPRVMPPANPTAQLQTAPPVQGRRDAPQERTRQQPIQSTAPQPQKPAETPRRTEREREPNPQRNAVN